LYGYERARRKKKKKIIIKNKAKEKLFKSINKTLSITYTQHKNAKCKRNNNLSWRNSNHKKV
jgi:hypothetical protein